MNGRLRGLRVLVVEDNALGRGLTRMFLEDLGCSVATVGSGEAALEELGRATYDLVLMDWRMPEMDGIETVRRLREEEARQGRRRVRVVACTAYGGPEDRDRCLAAGMDGVLVKPFGTEELRRALSEQGGEAVARLEPGALEGIRALEARGRPGLARRVAAAYREESARLVGALARAVEAGDWEGVRRAAHALRSSSTSVGAGVLVRACEALEAEARRGPVGDARGRVEAIRRLREEAVSALDRWTGKEGGDGRD